MGAVIRHVWDRVDHDDCLDLAAEVSYYFVLSLFPFFLVIAAIVGWFPSTVLWHSFTEWVVTYFPRLSQNLVLSTMLELRNVFKGVLSAGLVMTVWAASSGFMSLMRALTTAHGKKEERSYWKRRAIAIGATLGAAGFFLFSFAFWTAGKWAALNLATSFQQLLTWQAKWKVAWWVLTSLLMLFGIDLLNYFLPAGSHRWRWISPGTAFVALTFAAGTAGVNLYVRFSPMLPRVYGTFAGFIILLTWIYVATLILLIGAEIDSALEELRGEACA